MVLLRLHGVIDSVDCANAVPVPDLLDNESSSVNIHTRRSRRDCRGT